MFSRLVLAQFWPAALLVLAGMLAYANSLPAPFIFDDLDAIRENQTIRSVRTSLSPPHEGSGVDSRPVVNLTLALNYAAGGLDPAGYRATNVAIHLLAGLALFGVVRRTLLNSALAGDKGTPGYRVEHERTTWLALTAALLWTLHPLQTESVTCVIQRTESLMGMFYLATLYGFIRFAEEPERTRWAFLSVGACLLGMGTKEVMVSAPLLVWLYDRTFVAGTFRGAWQQRRGYYGALASTWILLGWLVLSSGADRGGAAGTGTEVTVWSYALTQAGAIVRYLGLAFWPSPLVLDYGTPVMKDLGSVLPQALLVVAIVGATVFALRRRPAWGFLGAWFLAILAPSSSFLPLLTQTVAEHRMYLSLAAVIVALLLVAHRWIGRATLFAGLALAVGAGWLTHQRNHDYRTEVAIWQDTVDKVPGNARAHSNLGLVLGAAGRNSEGEQALREAVRINPALPFAHFNLAAILARVGRDAEAVPAFEAELRLQPNYAPAWCELGLSLYQLGRRAEAVSAYEKALAARPDYPEALERLGIALASLGRLPEAIARYEQAERLRPDSPGIRLNLGIALALSGRLPAAIAEFERAVALDPEFAEAHLALARALADSGRPAQAAAHQQTAQELRAKRR